MTNRSGLPKTASSRTLPERPSSSKGDLRLVRRTSKRVIGTDLAPTSKSSPANPNRTSNNLSSKPTARIATALEEELVRSLAVARWPLSRVAALETNLFENEIARSQPDIDDEFVEIEDLGRLAFVFRKLAEHSQSLLLLGGYKNSLNSTCDRARKHLIAAPKLRNEPKPEPPKPEMSKEVGLWRRLILQPSRRFPLPTTIALRR